MQKSVLNIYSIYNSCNVSNTYKGYLVCIFADRKKDVTVGITECESVLSISNLCKYSKLVYFEKFKNRRKAMLKKRILAGYDKFKIVSFISKKNPDWLNLIQLFSDDL